MKLDRRGDIGFMEAMAGAMTVCLVLTSFSAFLAADILAEEPEEPEFDWNSLGDIGLDHGNMGVSLKTDFRQYMDDNGFTGIELKVEVLQGAGNHLTYLVGERTDIAAKDSRAVEARDGNGRILPALAEVTIYL